MHATFRFCTFVLLCVAYSGSLAAGNEEKFRQAYDAYQEHTAANETKAALAAAKTAFQEGSKLFGKDSANTANLASNYAGLLNDTGEYSKARKTLSGKLDILEKRFGPDAIELVSMLVELGRAHLNAKSPQKALTYFDRAVDLAEEHENAVYPAQRNFEIATELLNRGHHAISEPFMRRAHDGFNKTLQPNDIRLGLTSYQMALWASSRRQHEQAIDYLNGSLAAFTTHDGKMGDLERTVRRRLVHAFETTGNRDAATEHCLAVGAAQVWSMPPTPLYSTRATFPPAAFENKQSGEVVLSFTIDDEGFVEDASVERSSNPVFDAAALEMIRQYRYPPRFENGSPVATDGVKVTASFEFAKSGPGFKGDFNIPPLPGFHGPRPFDPSECDPNDPTYADRCRVGKN